MAPALSSEVVPRDPRNHRRPRDEAVDLELPCFFETAIPVSSSGA